MSFWTQVGVTYCSTLHWHLVFVSLPREKKSIFTKHFSNGKPADRESGKLFTSPLKRCTFIRGEKGDHPVATTMAHFSCSVTQQPHSREETAGPRAAVHPQVTRSPGAGASVGSRRHRPREEYSLGLGTGSFGLDCTKHPPDMQSTTERKECA